MKKKKQASRITTIAFLAILILLPLATLFSHKEYFSETENRTLAQFPKLSFSKIMDKSFMNGFETYVSDHFAGRLNWITTKVNIELMLGKKELNGIYIADDRLIEKLPTPDYTEIDKSIDAINTFTANNSNVPVYFLLAPTSAGIYTDELPKNAPQEDQKAFINYVYNNLSENITTIDIYNIMHTMRDEYIYYRNDHHWTSLGAYYAYNVSIQKLGFSPIVYDKYDIEHASDSFKGTFYSTSLYDRIKPDTIDIYRYDEGSSVTNYIVNDGKELKEYDSIYFREYLEQKDKYCTYLGPNQPVVTIKTDVHNDKKLLIIKDSYAHCFAPFLTQHYSEITLIDLRYIGVSAKDIVNISDYSQVLFLYNASTFSTDENVKQLAFMFKE
ncbi:MAG: DHHW family protein [Oscillospiraceae bacterium]